MLQRCAEDLGLRRVSPRAALIAIAALEADTFLAADIAEARDIDAPRTPAIFDIFGHPGDIARDADAEDMVHHIAAQCPAGVEVALGRRSEEHTSELQSLMRNSSDGFCL